MRAQLQAVRLVTVAAHHAGLVHLALHEGGVLIVFIAYLAVVMVQRPLRQRDAMGVEQRHAVVVITQRAATRVTAPATVNLRIGCEGRSASGDVGILGKRPFSAL